MSAMHISTAITLLILKTAILVAGQNVTLTNTTTIITTVITTTTNNRTNATMPSPPPPTNMTTTTTPTTTSSRMTTLPSVTSTWGFHCDADEICALLGYDAALRGKGLPLNAVLYPRRTQISGPLMYCWFPCYGGSCGGYSLPQNPPSGGSLSWWFGFQFQWSRNKPRQGYPCRSGSRNRRRKGC